MKFSCAPFRFRILILPHIQRARSPLRFLQGSPKLDPSRVRQYWHQRQVLTPLFFHFPSVFGHEHRIYRSYCARPYAYPHISLTVIFVTMQNFEPLDKESVASWKRFTTNEFHGQIMDQYIMNCVGDQFSEISQLILCPLRFLP